MPFKTAEADNLPDHFAGGVIARVAAFSEYAWRLELEDAGDDLWILVFEQIDKTPVGFCLCAQELLQHPGLFAEHFGECIAVRFGSRRQQILRHRPQGIDRGGERERIAIAVEHGAAQARKMQRAYVALVTLGDQKLARHHL